MKVVHTYSGSRYMIDEEAQTFRRLRGLDSPPIENDNEEIQYLQILHLRKGSPMEILWLLDGKEKIRTTTPVEKIVDVN